MKELWPARMGDIGTAGSRMLSSLFPLLYGTLFFALLWQAFRVMGKGFRAASGPISQASDRTGRITVHPELLDSEGRITEEDLLTVRFSGDNEPTDEHGETEAE
tara:strand:+ start:528 stop:839 length:312 start_codon:yes stop_codon:yes gene_type:complete